jgi:hypothetical protein
MSQCLTGKTIGELSTLSGLSGNTLFIVEQDGITYHIPFSAFGINANSCITETLTYAQMTGKTSTNSLKPGCFYMITDADPTLYGGTNIVLQAITTNQLSLQGHGLFYTPPYDQNVAGFGIWTDRVTIASLDIIGWVASLNYSGSITPAYTDGGGSGFEIDLTLVNGNVISWSVIDYGYNYSIGDIIRINGSQIGGTTGVNDIDFTVTDSITYTSGDTTIWGGYVWENLTGNLGSTVDIYTLNALDWSAKTYNPVDYNVSVDIIHYDFDNNTIIYRKDKLNNEVSFEYGSLEVIYGDIGPEYNPIKSFQWGNIDITTFLKGVKSNKILDSLLDCINFRGTCVINNNLTNLSFIYENLFEGSALLYNNNLTNLSTITNNELIDSTLIFSEISRGSIYSNIITNNSIIFRNTLSQQSLLINNTINNSIISTNTLEFSEIKFNNLIGSSITFSNFKDSEISNNSLDNSFIDSNNLMYSTLTTLSGIGTLMGKSVNQLTVMHSDVNTDISLATDIYLNCSKTIFKNSAGTPRLSYYNGSDVQIITNVDN